MNKDNEYILNLILVILSALTLLLSNMLWLDFKTNPVKRELLSVEPEYDSKKLFTELLKPQKVVATYNGKHHFVFEFEEIYSTYQPIIYDVFSHSNASEGSEITIEEYMLLQNSPSIVFFYPNSIDLSVLVNLISHEGQEGISTININEIYMSRDTIVIGNGEKYLKFPRNINIDGTLSSLASESLPEAKNFLELYAVNKNIYLPSDDLYNMKKLSYSNNLKTLMSDEDSIESLTLRFLNKSSDQVRDIVQDESRNLIYDNEYLNLYSSGIIEYENFNPVESKTRNLYTSFKSAMYFISNRVGSSGFYISEIIPIEDNQNQGFTFRFNLTEGSYPVVVNNDKYPFYIEITVFNNQVTHFVQNYKKVLRNTVPLHEEFYGVSLKEIITSSNVFNEPFADALKNISDITITYLDNTANGQQELKRALLIEYKNRKLYFSLDSGRLLLEK